MLAIRLGRVMYKLIALNQLVFLKGILFMDGVVAVNEVIDLAKRSRKPCLIFEVDFKKVYDSIS